MQLLMGGNTAFDPNETSGATFDTQVAYAVAELIATWNNALGDGAASTGVTIDPDGQDRDGTALFFQIGANSNQFLTVNIADMQLDALFRRANDLVREDPNRDPRNTRPDGIGEGLGTGADVLAALRHMNTSTGVTVGEGIRNAQTGEEIEWLINEVQFVLDDISNQRAVLGAVSNRLDFTTRSLEISSENLSDAESRVRNTDMAREMMRFTMSNVLQQAAVSMLAQANQLPNNLLQLLR